MVNKTLSYHTKCGHNFTQSLSDESQIELRNEVFRFYQGRIQIPVTIFGLIFTVCYIAAVYNIHIMQVFSTLFIGCFWSAMVSYVSLGFLKLYGIARPLHYRHNVTVKRTTQLIVLSWLAFIILVFMTLSVSALAKIEFLAVWSGCSVETCVHDMYIVRNGTTSLSYFITIICFIITVVLIKRARKFAKSLHSSNNGSGAAAKKNSKTLRRRFRFPLIKLTLNVLTFAIFHLPYTVWTTFLTFADSCFYIIHYNEMQMFMGFVRLSLLIRITLDSIISFCTDKELRLALQSICGYTGSRIVPRGSSGNFRTSISVGEISSESGTRRSKNGTGNSANSRKARNTRSNTLATTIDEPVSEVEIDTSGIHRVKSERANFAKKHDSVEIDSTFQEVDFQTVPHK